VDGDVEAGLINVKGQLLGSVDCETLTIAGRASVDGKVSYQSIQIQRGGLFRGDIVKK
jgi:cytoskeletal protein CcmA (bactofilin family)